MVKPYKQLGLLNIYRYSLSDKLLFAWISKHWILLEKILQMCKQVAHDYFLGILAL